ncbi:hypothetical protein ASPVEDRAFT_53274 [Aspergillus versicolor CBS 583.65]|uniref:Uncharacterized protein n=1 Tax=Aspergillus versicolor CBS 583.65 TaxID=1036611 RepID=A0A1L9PMH2_ASPVE|nr:uncharacterized protein ASPVEDRAFT_53274 [Aspergillus versicolor CBS 583.65]OJJ02636.1 hypothetical protein ASPVEDRAFT_53274 [Aspergillus versicolor CBS 583.65]
MEAWPARHESLHFTLLSQSSPALPIEPLAGYSGAVSRHNYRKSLYGSTTTGNFFDSPEGKTLRRKNAASNLNRSAATPTAQMGTICQNVCYHPFSASSATSSPPPPLSPSYSPSALSDQLPELLDGYGCPLSPVLDASLAGEKQSPYKLLDNFRDRLEKFPDPETPDIVEFHGHSRTRSDSVLFKTRRAKKPPITATVVHQGTQFEILNPHESLDFARIVSYIEDVDSHLPGNHHRDSYLRSSHGSNVIPEDLYETTSDIINVEERAHDDLVGDSPHHPMPSISERLEDMDAESCYSSIMPLSRPLSMVRPQTAHNETDLGEPGPPIYFDDDIDNNQPAPLPSTLDLNPVELAALCNIGHLPPQGKGADNPTAVIYSNHPPLRKRSALRKTHKTPSPSSFPFSHSPAGSPTSAPLKRLRGFAQNLRRKTKTLPRASLS